MRAERSPKKKSKTGFNKRPNQMSNVKPESTNVRKLAGFELALCKLDLAWAFCKRQLTQTGIV